MTNTCRRCPAGVRRLGTSLLPGQAGQSGFRVAVVAGRIQEPSSGSDRPAGFGDEPGLETRNGDPSQELDWRDAVVALAAAVLERGGTLVAPANIELVGLLAQAAIPHARPRPAETHRSPFGPAMQAEPTAPVAAVETGGHSAVARQVLAPYARRNALEYFDADMQRIPLDYRPALTDNAVRLDDDSHHPFNSMLVRGVTGVVIVHPDVQTHSEVLEAGDMPSMAVFRGTQGPPSVEQWALEYDPTREMLRQYVGDDDRLWEETVPYALVMELLVDSWLDRPLPTATV